METLAYILHINDIYQKNRSTEGDNFPVFRKSQYVHTYGEKVTKRRLSFLFIKKGKEKKHFYCLQCSFKSLLQKNLCLCAEDHFYTIAMNT